MLKISSSATSNIGKNIRTNEDNFYMNGIFLSEENTTANGAVYNDSVNRRIQFYAVFDGIGKDVKSDLNPNVVFSNGQYPSHLSAILLSRLQKYLKTKQEYNLDNYIHTFVRNANKEICNHMRNTNIRTGASFALLCLERRGAIRAYNMGNSKVFMFRDNRIIQLTQNDTQVENLILSRQISADIARYSPENKILTQHLGMFEHEREIKLHTNSRFTLKNGDKFLICTDALCDFLTNSRICQILGRDISEQEIVNDLMTEALQNGGGNNLTIIVVGANQLEDASAKKGLIMPDENEVTNFTPLRYKKAFAIKPKHLKQAGMIALGVVLFVLAITLIINGPLRTFFGKDEETETSTGVPPDTSDNIVISTEPLTQPDETEPPLTSERQDDDDFNDFVPPDPNANDYVGENTEETAAPTPAPTPAPTQPPTAPPATSPPPTQPPTAPPTAAPTEAPTPPPTEAPTEPPVEATPEPPTEPLPAETTEAAPVEQTTEPIVETPPPETVPVTEAPAEPEPEPTLPPEPTIGAE